MRFLLLVIAVTLGGCSCCFKGPSGSEDSESTPNALKLPQLPSEPEAQWNPFEPLNGWSVKSEVPNRHYRLTFELAVPQADLDDHSYVLWVMFNPSVGNLTTLDWTIRKVMGYTFGQKSPFYRDTDFTTIVDGAFPQNWQLRGLKIVNLYAQRSSSFVVDPNDQEDLQHNPIEDKITECQNDSRCKAIVAAWGTTPGSKVYPPETNKNVIIARKNEIARLMNNVHTPVGRNKQKKGGYVGTLTGTPGERQYPRHPLWNNRNAQFGDPPDVPVGHWRKIPDVLPMS